MVLNEIINKNIIMKKFKLFVLLLLGVNLIISCGKPTTPEIVVPPDVSGGYKIVNKYATSAYAQDVLEKDGLLYIAQGEGGLVIIDASDPLNPETISITTEEVRGYSVKIAMVDSAVYLAAGSFGVTVLNAVDPMVPYVTVSNTSMKPAKSNHILGKYLFTAVSEQGIDISDISYPTYPDGRGHIYTAGFAYGLTTSSDTAYMFVASGEMGFFMYDISDFQNGHPNYRQVGWCDTPGKAEMVSILEEESIALMACGTSGLQIIDYADTNNVYVMGFYDGRGYAKDLIYEDDKVYMTAELGGLQIIDVTDRTNPQIIGLVETEYALGLETDEDYIYIADEDEGLIIVSKPD